MKRINVFFIVLALACGSQGPTAPSTPAQGSTPSAQATPQPPVSPPATPPVATGVTVTGTILDSLSGATVGTFTQAVTSLPAAIAVSAPNYLTRDAWVSTAAPRVDLFPMRGFDLDFYRQLLRNDLQRGADPLEPLRILTQAPSFFVETEGRKGFPKPLVDQLEQLARQLVPELSGGRFQVARWETGPEARPRQNGWIVIEREDTSGICGQAYVGEVAGQIWLSDKSGCRVGNTFAHELGHAFGYWHVTRAGTMMFPRANSDDQSTADAPNEIERHHMRLAYTRARGNRDVDVDTPPPTTRTMAQIVE